MTKRFNVARPVVVAAALAVAALAGAATPTVAAPYSPATTAELARIFTPQTAGADARGDVTLAHWRRWGHRHHRHCWWKRRCWWSHGHRRCRSYRVCG